MRIVIINNKDGTFYFSIRDNKYIASSLTLTWEEVLKQLTELTPPK